MKQGHKKPYLWAILYSLILIGCSAYVVLDTFVIPKSEKKLASTGSTVTKELEETKGEAVITDSSYEDENMKITITKTYEYESNVYTVDIQVNDPALLKTALAGNAYGRNLKDTTSAMAAEHNAILAINGDYYGFRDNGYVVRNGEILRTAARTEDTTDALVIDKSGNFSVIDEAQTTLDSLDTGNLWQVLSFGPGLVENGELTVDENSEVGQAMNSNPRTSIGQISDLHYVIVVSDGRTSESQGLSLYQLATKLKELGCKTAYNLDGGGSTTLYFNGEVINVPTDGKGTGERRVSDIVYFGY